MKHYLGFWTDQHIYLMMVPSPVNGILESLQVKRKSRCGHCVTVRSKPNWLMFTNRLPKVCFDPVESSEVYTRKKKQKTDNIKFFKLLFLIV